MKNKITLQIKGIVLLGILILTTVFLFEGVISQGQTAMSCAEKTTYGAWCLTVPFDEVDTNYRYDNHTSCEATPYCSTGTCVNTGTGKCSIGPQATCDQTQGGVFYSQPKDEVTQCKIGCCLLGDEAVPAERVMCDTLGKDWGVTATFRPDIQDEFTCVALASPEAKGACVFETDLGRDCSAITRKECQDSAGEFHEGFLCTAPDLGTICAMTKKTTCVEGRNEVYFIDSCGNIANIYDSGKVDDIPYWSFVPGVEGIEVDVGDGLGNAGSKTNGYCDYLDGSTCRRYDRGIDLNKPTYGDYICRDLSCSKTNPLSGGLDRAHGEEWCSESIENFKNAKPGQLSYLLYCYDGEIQYELCDSFRNKLCSQNENTGRADCIMNKWMECIQQENTRDCESIELDCEVIKGASIFRTVYGTEKLIRDSGAGEDVIGVCVPKYIPGFKFWDPKGTMLSVSDETPLSICEFSNVNCFVNYTQEVISITKWRAGPPDGCVELCKSTEGWSNAECYEACTPKCLGDPLEGKNALAKIEKDWAESWQNLCVSLGDCGVSANSFGYEGYNRWRDLFKGLKDEIDWATLPNAESKK